jgi:hypothetical protein
MQINIYIYIYHVMTHKLSSQNIIFLRENTNNVSPSNGSNFQLLMKKKILKSNFLYFLNQSMY